MKFSLAPYKERRYLLSRGIALLIVAFGIVLDVLTKRLAVTHLKGNASFVLIPGVFQLTYAENPGAAFSSFSDKPWVFMTVSTVAILAITLYILYKTDLSPFFLYSLAAVLSGGIGNMIERVSQGYVVDFFDFCLIDFAIFNVADCFVTVGAGCMILALVLEIVAEAKKNADHG